MTTDVTSYTELIAGIRDQLGALGVRYQDFDDLAGFPAGLSGKVFGPAQVKRLGPEKLFDALNAAGLCLMLKPDPDQLEKMRKRIAENYNPREANQARMGNHASPVSTALLSRCFKHLSRSGGKARMRKMTKAQRSAHAQHAANTRWKRERKKRKVAHQRRQRAKLALVAEGAVI